MNCNIFIVEDDITLAEGLCRALKTENISAESCKNIRSAREALKRGKYDLMLLDVNLPDGSGFDFLKEIKREYDFPVILLTANNMETDIVAGLESGADDYITKPFSLAVLRARVNAGLRRTERKSANVFARNGFVFDFDKMEFSANGAAVELSKTEQKLLRVLTDNAGITVSRSKLIDRLWDGADYVDENALSVTVNRLREKLSARKNIKTVYGIGYVWVNTDE